MGLLKDYFNSTKKAEKPKAVSGWIKISTGAGRNPFWYMATEEKGKYRVEVKVFKSAGSEDTVDIETGSITTKKYEIYTHYTFTYENKEEAGEKLLDNARNAMDYYHRGTQKKVYLD